VRAVRYRWDDRQQAASQSFIHKVIVGRTGFTLPSTSNDATQPGIQDIYALLATDSARNQLIVDDVIEAVCAGRSPVLLTERREHLAYFTDALADKVKIFSFCLVGWGENSGAY